MTADGGCLCIGCLERRLGRVRRMLPVYWRGSTASAAFDILALDGDDLRGLPLSIRKTNLARLLARRPDGIFVAPFEQGEIGPLCPA